MISAHQGLRMVSIDGAYPAVTYASEPALLGFYADVSNGFERVRRDGNERRGRRRRRYGQALFRILMLRHDP